MRLFTLIILLGGLLASAAPAQELDGEIYPEQVTAPPHMVAQNLNGPPFGASSLVELQQLVTDAGNMAAVNLTGLQNAAILSQFGYGNAGFITITGRYNQASLNQNGTGLLSIVDIEGDFNRFDMMQKGDDLQNHFRIYGFGLHFEAYQSNLGMELIQAGIGSIPLSIQQTGRPSPIVITNH